jgi:hypothetical protein
MTEPLQLLSRSQPTSGNALYVWESGGRRLIIKAYRGPRAQQRRDCERRLLELWGSHGLDVPTTVDVLVPGVVGPYLALDHVAGASLRTELGRPLPAASRLELIELALVSLCRRQELACSLGDLRLIHPDPNTGNVILEGRRAVWIDLESERRGRGIVPAAAQELAKLVRWASGDLGRSHVAAVAQRVVDVYRGREEILTTAIAQTCGRPWQWLHRRRDCRRKQAAPATVTKYDVADAFREALAGRTVA